MRTREVAERAGVNAQTLRYYERRGILAAPPRAPSGYRDYPAQVVDLLRFVKRAQQLGFSLAEVERLLEIAASGPERCEHARRIAVEHVADVDRKIADLTWMRASLVELAETCQRPRADRSCPLLDAITGPDAFRAASQA